MPIHGLTKLNAKQIITAHFSLFTYIHCSHRQSGHAAHTHANLLSQSCLANVIFSVRGKNANNVLPNPELVQHPRNDKVMIEQSSQSIPVLLINQILIAIMILAFHRT